MNPASSAPATGAPRAVGGGALLRALAAEARRVRGDRVPWLFLPVTLLSVASLIAALPDDIRSAPLPVVDSLGVTLREGPLATLLVGAAVLCAFGPTFAERAGVRPREQLFVPPAASLTARGLSSILIAVLYVTVGAGLLQAVFLTATGRMLLPGDLWARLLGAAVVVGLWGFLLGVIIRNPILVMFVVPATLMPAMLLIDPAPQIAQLLPLPVLLTVAGVFDQGVEAPLAVLLAAAWVGAVIAVVAALERWRDRL